MLADPFDALSRKGGLLGALGNALGGKAAMDAELGELGFVDTYTLAEYVCRGSRICLQLAYPYGWTASYRNAETDGWVPLFSGAPGRPTYQDIEAALVEADVPFRYTEFDINNIVVRGAPTHMTACRTSLSARVGALLSFARVDSRVSPATVNTLLRLCHDQLGHGAKSNDFLRKTSGKRAKLMHSMMQTTRTRMHAQSHLTAIGISAWCMPSQSI